MRSCGPAPLQFKDNPEWHAHVGPVRGYLHTTLPRTYSPAPLMALRPREPPLKHLERRPLAPRGAEVARKGKCGRAG
eukprot:12917634-Prorocentrum_lima.AAC.1